MLTVLGDEIKWGWRRVLKDLFEVRKQFGHVQGLIGDVEVLYLCKFERKSSSWLYP